MKNTHSKRHAGLITTLLPLQGVRRVEKDLFQAFSSLIDHLPISPNCPLSGSISSFPMSSSHLLSEFITPLWNTMFSSLRTQFQILNIVKMAWKGPALG